MYHIPVLLKEVLYWLNPKANQNFIDCTLGTGGHSEAILERTRPRGKLLGIDLDPEAIKISRKRLDKFKRRIILVQDNFRHLKKIISRFGFRPVHGILLDLGLSSRQIEKSGLGFSFKRDEPLDMRYGYLQETGLVAAKIVNTWSQEEIEKILKEYGQEKYARLISQKITEMRQKMPITSTSMLVQAVLQVKGGKRQERGGERIHPATKTFQALRIAVNDELGSLKDVLPQARDILEPEGRLIVISFHSLEDKIVKEFFRQESRDCLCPPEILVSRCGHKASLRIITKKVIKPTFQEIKVNPRSRSARMRVAESLN